MPTEKDVRRALRKVKDPELNLDLVVLGLIYDIDIVDSHVKATISLTSPFCPVAGQIVDETKAAIEGVDGVESAEPKQIFGEASLYWDGQPVVSPVPADPTPSPDPSGVDTPC